MRYFNRTLDSILEQAAPVAPPKPSPVKTPRRSPERKPSKSPWSPPKPKHIPQPKNYDGVSFLSQLTEGYEDEVEHHTTQFWRDLPRNKEHTFSMHPILALFGDELSRSSWQHTMDRARAVGVDMTQLIRDFMTIQELERKHRDELVNLAKNVTVQIWGIPKNMLEGHLAEGDIESNQSDEIDDSDIEISGEVRKQINKRLTLNTMTQGSAVHAMLTMHHLVDKAINKIDPRLLQLYNKISAGSHGQYWMINIPAMLQHLGAHAVGSSNVKWSDETPTIDARGVIFPVLAQEMSKGVAELLSHHGLADLDEPTTRTVLRHADNIEHEPYLIQVGPELWRRFLKVKPRNIPMADLYQALSQQSPDDLHAIISAVIEEPEKAERLLRDLISDPQGFNDIGGDEDWMTNEY
jgi:hypothetical protein